VWQPRTPQDPGNLRQDANAQTLAWPAKPRSWPQSGWPRRKPRDASALYSACSNLHCRSRSAGCVPRAPGLDADRGEGRILNLLRSADAALKPTAIAAIVTLPPDASLGSSPRPCPRSRHRAVLLIDAFAVRGGPDATARPATNFRPVTRRCAWRAGSRRTFGDATDVPRLAGSFLRQYPNNSRPSNSPWPLEAATSRPGVDQPIAQPDAGPKTRFSLPRPPCPRSAFPLFLPKRQPDEATAKLAFAA